MSINFPTSLDSLTNPLSTDTQDAVSHADQHSNANDAIEAIQAKVWINWSAVTSSLDYKTSRQTTKWDLLVHNGTSLDRLPAWTNWYMLVADSTQSNWLKYIAPSAWGTVTNVAWVNTNGFTFSIASPTASPSITLSTSITGILKGNGTAISAASAWTDYYAPWSTDVSVSDGWTGNSSMTAYAPVFGWTTGTWALQSGTVWTSGQVMTSNWAWAIGTFQDIGGNFTYAWTLQIATATSNGGGVQASTHYQLSGLSVWNVSLTRWTSGYAKLRYSPDNATWTDIVSVSTAWGYTFPILLRKGYYYYIEVDSPTGWSASTWTLTFMQ